MSGKSLCPWVSCKCLLCPWVSGQCVLCPWVSGKCVLCPWVSGKCVLCPWVSGQCVSCPRVSGKCNHATVERYLRMLTIYLHLYQYWIVEPSLFRIKLHYKYDIIMLTHKAEIYQSKGKYEFWNCKCVSCSYVPVQTVQYRIMRKYFSSDASVYSMGVAAICFLRILSKQRKILRSE